MATIQVNGHELHCQSQQPGGHQYCPDASSSDYILIRFKESLKSDQALRLQSLGVLLLRYVYYDTYTARYAPSDLESIRRLPFVEFANVFHNDLTLDPRLQASAPSQVMELAGTNDDTNNTDNDAHPSGNLYWIRVHDDSRVNEVVTAISQLHSIDISWICDQGFGMLKARLKPQHIQPTAQIDNVANVELVLPHVSHCQKATHILCEEGPAHTASLSTLAHDFDGTGEAIIIMDSGLDKGEDKSNGTDKSKALHPAFTNTSIIAWKTYTNSPDKPKDNNTGDLRGHGTCMTSCITANTQTADFSEVRGVAPGAAIIVKKVLYADGSAAEKVDPKVTWANMLTDYLDDKPPLPIVPRIANYSYGRNLQNPDKPAQLPYDSLAQIIDTLVYIHQDLVFVCSAGNNGRMQQLKAQVSAHSVGKHGISVGACYSSHPLKLPPGQVDKTGSLVYDKEGTVRSLNEVIPESNRGPSVEGRIKPDICAPGYVVYNARSSYPGVQLVGESLGETLDPAWWFTGGTSPAAAFISGVCALIRQAYKKRNDSYPSASMVKALLVNGATSLVPPSTGAFSRFTNMFKSGLRRIEPLTTNEAGWGRANFKASLSSIEGYHCIDSLRILTTHSALDFAGKKGRSITADTIITTLDLRKSGVSTFVATLVYLDSFTAAGNILGNEVSLKLVFADTNGVETVFWGEYDPNDATKPAQPIKNNVQKIMLSNVPKGVLSIAVIVHKRQPGKDGTPDFIHFAVAFDMF